MRIVLDANVVVAAFAARGLCEAILELCLDAHDIILSDHLLDEIHKNLVKKVKLPAKATREIIAFLRDNAQVLVPTKLPSNVCRDSDDIPVLGLALAAGADCIVTGDKDLLVLKKFGSVPIVTPRAFSDMIHGR